MTNPGELEYEMLIEHHREHHKIEDALIAERDKLRDLLTDNTTELEQMSAYADELFTDCNKFQDERDLLQKQLDVAMKALDDYQKYRMGAYDPGYAAEAKAEIAKLGEKK